MLVSKLEPQSINRFVWRERLQELATLSPASFVVLKFEAENYLRVLEGKPIPTFQQFDEDLYYFVCSNYKVAGVFKGKLMNVKSVENSSATKQEVLFYNLTQYDIHIQNYPNVSCEELLEHLENINLNFACLLMRLQLEKKSFLLSIAGENLPELIESYRGSKAEEVSDLKKYSLLIQGLLSEDETHNQKALFEEIELLGTKLGRIISLNKILKNNFLQNYQMYFTNETEIPIETLNFTVTKKGVPSQYYPFVQLALTHIPKAKNFKRSSFPYNMQSLAVLNLLAEENAYSEVETIRVAMNNYSRLEDTPAFFQNSNILLEQVFVKTECLHIIAHGKPANNGADEKKNGVTESFGVETFSKFKKMPVFMFLSVCHSDCSEIISHFFKHGGRVLVTVNGLLFNHNLNDYIEHFYNTLFSGQSVKLAFASMQLKLLTNKNPNCFRFKLYGDSNNLHF